MIVLNVHVPAETDPVSAIFPPTINTPKSTPDVDPKSLVVVSVKLTCEPLHIAIICPALAFDPLLVMYSNQAPS